VNRNECTKKNTVLDRKSAQPLSFMMQVMENGNIFTASIFPAGFIVAAVYAGCNRMLVVTYFILAFGE